MWGQPPAEAAAFREEVLGYMVDHWKRFDQAVREDLLDTADFDASGPTQADRRFRKYQGILKEFAEVFNGDWCASRKLVHFCSGAPRCCRNRAHTEQRMVQCLRKLVFHGAPLPPAAAKWTRLGPVLDILLLGACVHDVFAAVFMTLQYKAEATSPDASMDPQLLQDIMFSAVTGRRFSEAKDFLRSADNRSKLSQLALVLEPLRHLTSWLMRRARESDHLRQCGFLDCAHEATSPVWAASAYISTLIHARTPRLQLLWRTTGFKSLADWQAHAHHQVRAFRRLLLIVACSLWLRAGCLFGLFPWALGKLVDDRVDANERVNIAARFDRTSACCMQPGMARFLKQNKITGEMMLNDPQWQSILKAWARMLGLQICDLEWRHHRCRTRTHRDGQTRYGSFAALHINSEAKLVLKGIREKVKAAAQLQTPPPCDAPEVLKCSKPRNTSTAPRTAPQRLRASSAIQLLHWDRTRRLKETGQKVNPASQTAWAGTKAAFEKLTPESRALYERRASDSKELASGARKCKARAAAAKAQASKPVGIAALADSPQSSASATLGHPLSLTCSTSSDLVQETSPSVVFPVSESFAASFYKKHRNLSKSAKLFNSRCAAFATAPPPSKFPKQVAYPRCCGEVCMLDPQRGLYDSILRACTTLADRCGGVAQRVVQHDALFAFEVHIADLVDGRARLASLLFAWLPMSFARCGNHSAAQAFVLMKSLSSQREDHAGMLLEFRAHEFVTFLRQPPSPLHRSDIGPLLVLTHQELAKSLCDGVGEANSASFSQIVIKRISFKDKALYRVETTGVADDFEPIMVTPPPPGGRRCSGRRERRGPAHGSTSTSVGPDGRSTAPDFLAMLMEDPNPKRARPTSGAPSKPLAQPIAEVTTDDMEDRSCANCEHDVATRMVVMSPRPGP